jgi:hypothetical protein
MTKARILSSRINRNQFNREVAYGYLISGIVPPKKNAEKLSVVNYVQLEDCANEKGMSISEFVKFTKSNEDLSTAYARCIAINGSRQGNVDENYQRLYANEVLNNAGIAFKKDSKTRLDGIDKSIDAVIIGLNVKAYCIQKVRIGKGGHQDNVDNEIKQFINAADMYAQCVMVVFLDTDDNNFYDDCCALASQYDNVFVVNSDNVSTILNELKAA